MTFESRPKQPVFALVLAMITAYGTIAVLAGHVLNLHRMLPEAWYVTLGLASIVAVPTTWFAVKPRAEHIGVLRALGATIASGLFVGLVAAACITASMGEWEVIAFLGTPLPKSPALWVALGGILGATAAILGWAALAFGLSRVRRSPAVLDAEERLGVPGLGVATLAAAGAIVLATENELPGAIGVFGFGGAALVLLLARDFRRAAFVCRVFAGKEPSCEVNWDVGANELAALAPIADVRAGAMIVERTRESTYREPARGRGRVLLGATLAETLAPINRRVLLASVFLSVGLVLSGLRAAWAMADLV